MRWRLAVVCLAAACVAVPCAGAQRGRVQSDQETLIQLEHDWDEAFFNKDLDFIGRVLADEFIATYDDGSRGDKAKELKLAVEFNQRVESSTLDDFTVKVYGDTAVVWFTRHLAGISQGRRLELTFRFTDVFVVRDGRWQCVSSQSTKVPAQ
jgi:ketosteroid isomerase-like protein